MPPKEGAAAKRVSRGLVGAIRPIAAAIIHRDEQILVWDDHDPTTGEVVAVPLAGGIEFGETGEEAIRRELSEEIGATAAHVQYVGLLENVYDWAGERRHELYLIYNVELAEPRFYRVDEIEVDEGGGDRYMARWRPLNEFRSTSRLVPDGLLTLIEQ